MVNTFPQPKPMRTRPVPAMHEQKNQWQATRRWATRPIVVQQAATANATLAVAWRVSGRASERERVLVERLLYATTLHSADESARKLRESSRSGSVKIRGN